MSSFTPHTPDEVKSMLEFMGLTSVEQLYDTIPTALQLRRALDLPEALSEVEVIEELGAYGKRNRSSSNDLICFAGGGSYDHDIATVTSTLGLRGEFVTAYTPYQPEVAQGVLQAIFEFQTMISRISGLAITNASLYDGGSALVEAINLACAKTRRGKVIISEAVNPNWRGVAATFAEGPEHEIITAAIDKEGRTIWPEADSKVAAYVVAYPNYLGFIEDISAVRKLASDSGALMIVAYDPIAISLLKSPGELGADIAIAEGQPLGIPLSYGGPYLGLFSVTMDLVRLLPGRLVGETVDTHDRTSYVTTLRAREQDIRREKASSNVCTNQTLMAVWAAIQMSWWGREGFYEVGRSSLSSRVYLEDRLLEEGLLDKKGGVPTFREFPVRLPKDASEVVEAMIGEGFLAGVALEGANSITNFDGSLLIALTEKRTKAQIDSFVKSLKEVAK
ncbi:MAG: aminomethyl-transferring glycine dehydrogenase subunit GcvPA [Actinomycetota bacterium]|nr:aminomethyl-transferring glycine dehydrogenase subunit GcvPA [Actinomycetota bacterium]